MAARKDKLLDHLVDLQLRPITTEWNQIRYWSALDDPDEEKWDNIVHSTAVERKYSESEYESDVFADDTKEPSGFKRRFTIPPLWMYAGIFVLLVVLGISAFFIWEKLSSSKSDNAGKYAPVEAYMVTLGNREIGIVAQSDRSGVEAYMQALTQQAMLQAGTDVVPEQSIRFEPILVDAVYVPNVDDVNAVIARHTVFMPIGPAPSTETTSAEPSTEETTTEEASTEETGETETETEG